MSARVALVAQIMSELNSANRKGLVPELDAFDRMVDEIVTVLNERYSVNHIAITDIDVMALSIMRARGCGTKIDGERMLCRKDCHCREDSVAMIAALNVIERVVADSRVTHAFKVPA